MPGDLSGVTAWEGLVPPVGIGPARPGTITLGDIVAGRGYEWIMSSMSGLDLSRRSLQLTPLHLANWAVIELLARPLFQDGVWVQVQVHQLGLVVDSVGEVQELWLARDARVDDPPGPEAVGAWIGGLLRPVAASTTAGSRIHERAVATIAAESAIAGMFRAARSSGRNDDLDWLQQASTAISSALGAGVRGRYLHCRPDDGAVVVVPARSLCCVLNSTPSPHACPGCPVVVRASSQVGAVTDWLAAMADAEFRDSTGRPRVTRAAHASGP